MYQSNFKISIIVPIYSVEQYIERCAISLFEQTYDNIEYVFVNDCTKDNSVAILEKTLENYPNRKHHTKIIYHEHNLGLGGARLTGLQNATGDYVWCVDSDDWVETCAVEKIIPFIENGYDYIVFNYYEECKDRTVRFNNKQLTVDNVLCTAVSPSIWKCFVKKELLYENSIFPVVGINQAEDYLLTSRIILIAKTPILLSDQYLYHYNLTNTNSYVNNITVKSMESCAKVCMIVKDFYYKKGELDKYKVSLAVRMALWYLDFEKIDKENKFCIELASQIYKMDRLVSLITKMPIFGKVGLLRLYRKIRLKTTLK